MEAFPAITTERLLLDQLRPTDIPLIVAYAANRTVSKFTVHLPFPYREKDAINLLHLAHKGFENKTYFIFAIRQKKEESFIGTVALKVEPRFFRAAAHYWIGEPFWNNGFASEAVKAILHFGFEKLGLHKVTATTLVKNRAAEKVLQNCSFLKEGILREHICNEFVFHDLAVYGLTRHDYQDNLQALP